MLEASYWFRKESCQFVQICLPAKPAARRPAKDIAILNNQSWYQAGWRMDR